MKMPFSIWSVVFVAIGLLALVINWISSEIIEPIVLLGFLLLLLGIIFSFIAFSKREKGGLKIVSGVSFFVVLFFLVWFEPFLFVYIITWLKNVIWKFKSDNLVLEFKHHDVILISDILASNPTFLRFSSQIPGFKGGYYKIVDSRFDYDYLYEVISKTQEWNG